LRTSNTFDPSAAGSEMVKKRRTKAEAMFKRIEQ
jgi:hypothetical protein